MVLDNEVKSDSNMPYTNRADFYYKAKTTVEYSIDTIRFRFILSQENFEKYTQKIISKNVKYSELTNDTFEEDCLDVVSERFICQNIYNQPFEALKEQNQYRCFLEFSLPKYKYGTNLSKATFQDLYDYYQGCLSFWSVSSEIFLNRLDISYNFSFESQKALDTFEQFLRLVKIGNSSQKSHKDYDFWKFEDRCVRFYKKVDELSFHKKNILDFDSAQKSFENLQKEAYYKHFAKEFCIGRLEFEYKRDFIERKFRSNCFEKIYPEIQVFDWQSLFIKDFPFLFASDVLTYTSNEEKDIKILESLGGSRLCADFFKFLYLARSNSIDFAESFWQKKYSQKLYIYRKNSFYNLTGLTLEQAVQDAEVKVFFPNKTIYLDTSNLDFSNQLQDFDYRTFKKKFNRAKRRLESLKIKRLHKLESRE